MLEGAIIITITILYSYVHKLPQTKRLKFKIKFKKTGFFLCLIKSKFHIKTIFFSKTIIRRHQTFAFSFDLIPAHWHLDKFNIFRLETVKVDGLQPKISLFTITTITGSDDTNTCYDGLLVNKSKKDAKLQKFNKLWKVKEFLHEIHTTYDVHMYIYTYICMHECLCVKVCICMYVLKTV